jgi:hypothetical protein
MASVERLKCSTSDRRSQKRSQFRPRIDYVANVGIRERTERAPVQELANNNGKTPLRSKHFTWTVVPIPPPSLK